MAYTAFLFDKAYIDSVAAQAATNLKANKGLSNLQGYAIGVIVYRLQKDPKRYRDYGVYWAALKEVLRSAGYNFGDPVYPFLLNTYKGDTDLQTIIMAEEFRNWYLQTQAIGTCQFVLDQDNPEIVTLTDDQMDGFST